MKNQRITGTGDTVAARHTSNTATTRDTPTVSGYATY
jgi:hypothetical protein